MKNTIKPSAGMSALQTIKPLLMAAMCGLLAMPGIGRADDNSKPGIAPPHSRPHGRSYAEWSAALMQWMFSLPTTHHPVFDTAALSAGQTDHVWFLAGNFTGAPVTRNAIIPEGTALFIDLLNYWADDTDCPHPDSFTVAQLRALAKAAMDPAFGLHCTIDGVPVTGLSDPSHTAYRVQAPVFTYTVPPVNNLLSYFGLACYTDTSPNPSPIFVNANAITDGYYVFLEPLAPGEHTIRFGGSIPGFSEDVTYHITVTKGYTFTKLRTLGDPIPGRSGVSFMGDFEPWDINNQGQQSFVADLSIGSEGVFRITDGQVMPILLAGDTAPGGGTFSGFGSMGKAALNQAGDMAVGFNLLPAGAPLGVNAGLYFYSSHVNSLTALVVPGVTPAPGGGTFQGINFQADINNERTVVFPGIVHTDHGIHVTGQTYGGLGVSVFQVNPFGKISSVISAGDGTPQGGTFDYFQTPVINSAGDIAVDTHRAEDAQVGAGDQSLNIFTGTTGLYLRKHDDHQKLVAIARAGDTVPGGGDTYRVIFGPSLNDGGQIAFIGDLTSGAFFGDNEALFLYQGDHRTVSVARRGDLMPGGGHLVRTTFQPGNYALNNHGLVAFIAVLDTDDDHDGVSDTGLYVWSEGRVSLVARSGAVTPGAGIIAHFRNAYSVPATMPDPSGANGGVALNDRGQIFFAAILSDGRDILFLATPNP